MVYLCVSSPSVARVSHSNSETMSVKSIINYRTIEGMLACGLLALVLLYSPKADGQRRRRPASATLDVEATLAKAQELYQAYQLDEASKLLGDLSSQLARRKQEMPASLSLLSERVERAQRLLPRVERLTVKQSKAVAIHDINAELARMVPRIATAVRLVHSDTLATSEYRSPLGNLGLLAEPTPRGDYDLGQLELLSDKSQGLTETSFSSTINTAEHENFPYMMPDGITLLFARASHEGLGGYDLYLSRYQWSRGLYLEPMPLGMPFNSPYNDYLLAYDDVRDETLLVSDRYCETGQVRLYLFEGLPRAVGSSVESSAEVELAPEDMLRYATLQQAPKEEEEVYKPRIETEASLYYRQYGLPEAQTQAGQRLAREAIATRERLDVALERQARIRQSYRQSTESRRELAPELRALEQDIQSLRTAYARLVKEVRNAEAKGKKTND